MAKTPKKPVKKKTPPKRKPKVGSVPATPTTDCCGTVQQIIDAFAGLGTGVGGFLYISPAGVISALAFPSVGAKIVGADPSGPYMQNP